MKILWKWKLEPDWELEWNPYQFLFSNHLKTWLLKVEWQLELALYKFANTIKANCKLLPFEQYEMQNWFGILPHYLWRFKASIFIILGFWIVNTMNNWTYIICIFELTTLLLKVGTCQKTFVTGCMYELDITHQTHMFQSIL